MKTNQDLWRLSYRPGYPCWVRNYKFNELMLKLAGGIVLLQLYEQYGYYGRQLVEAKYYPLQ